MKSSHIIPITLALLFSTPTSVIAQKNDDNTSKVQFYTFGNTLEEQEAQLADNPLVLQFAADRKAMAEDRYRPIFHYVNPSGSLNDPNGLCFWNGKWHLFYQAYPSEDRRQHWGHAVSDDLVYWKDLPYAIYPHPELKVYSGSTLVDSDKVIAMYHGTMVGNMVATSSDPLLLNWEKVSGNAVIPIENPAGFSLPYSVFDPCIWKKDGVYYSLSAGKVNQEATNKTTRANFLFRSKDLVHWEYLHEFTENDRFSKIGDDGACPYFWPIGDKYMLNYFSHMSGGQYLLGDYDKENDKFIVTSGGRYNHGYGNPGGVHAPSATPDGNGNIIIIFNMQPGYATQGWNQIMSLPRKLSLLPGDVIGQEAAADYSKLHYGEQIVGQTKLPANKEVVLKKVKGDAMEIKAEIDMNNSQVVELNVLRSPNKEEYTKIIIYKEKGTASGLGYTAAEGTAYMPDDLTAGYTGQKLTRVRTQRQSLISLETENGSTLPGANIRPPETAEFTLSKDEHVNLHIFIDKSIVEVFVNGVQCVAARVYPGRKDSIGISLKSRNNDAELVSLQSWKMKNIYE